MKAIQVLASAYLFTHQIVLWFVRPPSVIGNG